jgi:hypothetical protein
MIENTARMGILGYDEMIIINMEIEHIWLVVQFHHLEK